MTTRNYFTSMKTAGVKQLKARLSEYLRLVRAGETILVTDRDEVIAELRPVAPRSAPREGLDDLLDGLAESGELTRAALPKQDWTWSASGLGLPEGTARKLLDELRAERQR
ncbi:MAG: type II toxin-antitoxin system Phd/YefM family antitoxin [Gemmatimonadetes bacterium]|nr:type II toxin-antitoxin system Phd/YefM family antitoxin [Gemmatimonadota bacterium]